MFSGTFSFLSPSPSGGGAAGTFTSGSGSGGLFSFGTPVARVRNSPVAYSYQSAPAYNYQASAPYYSLPSAGIQSGPFGERGPYTPLDFPIMRELIPGERLENLNPGSGFVEGSVLPYLALGIVAAFLLKK